MANKIRVKDCYEVPTAVGRDVAYRLLPKNSNDAYYCERTDRNIGWITAGEQGMLRRTVIGIAGCGGMGAQLAEKFLRLGVGEVRIADSEAFDASNINRQFAATRKAIGKSKALETAKMLRMITDDSKIVVYPQGISEDTVDQFIKSCDVICDEIEFWRVGARILLHKRARGQGMPIFVCNTIGFGSHVFLFTPESMTMEECLLMSYEEAKRWEETIAKGDVERRETVELMEHITEGLFPIWPEYCRNASKGNRAYTRRRLIAEGKGAIIATNPPLACGFVADRVLLYLLRASPIRRIVLAMPAAPGYLYFDAATMKTKIAKG